MEPRERHVVWIRSHNSFVQLPSWIVLLQILDFETPKVKFAITVAIL
jgi:hypothetical protein